MSFIDTKKGNGYAPGFFLAQDEQCVRKTKTIYADSAVTAEDGSKYVPMGTAYPSNDEYATGIVYEDVDVSTGDMPGSVVVKGTIYEDKLAPSGMEYNEASVTSADDPSDKGWYESDGNDGYTASTDTVAVKGKTYYEQGGSSPDYTYTEVADVEYGDNPKALGLYEKDNDEYILSTDTQADGSKTYYEGEFVRLSSDAKDALIALGFTFIQSPAPVERPY